MNNSKGFSLLEVTIAGALMCFLSLEFTKVHLNNQIAVKNLETKLDISNIMMLLNNYYSDINTCKKLEGISLGSQTKLVNGNNKIIIEVKDYGTYKLSSIILKKSSQPDTVDIDVTFNMKNKVMVKSLMVPATITGSTVSKCLGGGSTLSSNVIVGDLAIQPGSITMQSGNIHMHDGNIMMNKGGITIHNGEFRINSGDAYKPGGGSFLVSSDNRLKTIYSKFNSGNLSGIQPILYSYKKDNIHGYDHEKVYAGFEAQNVQKNIPEAVNVDDKGFLVVNQDVIMLVLINKVNELERKLNDKNKATNTVKRKLNNKN
jgi:hypothetical protein